MAVKSLTRLNLGEYLTSLRAARGFSLRDIELMTDSSVSNAYLSQLEHGKIAKPSPNILHRLAEAFGIPYETLMEKAGYIVSLKDRRPNTKHGRVATFADKHLTPEEEEELLRYLGYLRTIRRRK